MLLTIIIMASFIVNLTIKAKRIVEIMIKAIMTIKAKRIVEIVLKAIITILIMTMAIIIIKSKVIYSVDL